MMSDMPERLPVWPVDGAGVRARLVLAVPAALHLLLFPVCVVLAVLTVVGWATAPLVVGLVLLAGAVPATSLVSRAHRTVAGRYLGEPVPAAYHSTAGLPPLSVVWTWLRDPARWRDLAHLAFSSTGGLVMSAFAVVPLVIPVAYVVLPAVVGWELLWLWLLAPVWLAVWWFAGPPVFAARLRVDRALLGPRETEALRERVEDVTASRAESLDHSAAEVRRIERDLHDGAQARLASLGMSLGLAEQVMRRDPVEAARLLARARDETVSALDDLRSVVRGIHPPVLADRGLVGAVEALTLHLAVPVSVSAALPGRPPDPVESAAYFAVAECLANVVKHAHATRARVSLRHADGVLQVEVEDDGRGGALTDSGTGLAGVARRLRAFDGTMVVDSPAGGPTVVRMEIPCALSSPRTTPSSATD